MGLTVPLAVRLGACAGNGCPSLAGPDDYDPAQASRVCAADGRLITDLGLEPRTMVPLPQISPALVQALLATEDKRFQSLGRKRSCRKANGLLQPVPD